MLEIEESLSSNVCRCTGYRPILEGFKRFAKDSPNPIKLPDIEDLHKCKKNGNICTKKCNDEDDWCLVSKDEVPNILEIDLQDGKCWYRVSTVQDIFDVWHKTGQDSYMLVAGNTAKGRYTISDFILEQGFSNFDCILFRECSKYLLNLKRKQK